MGRRLGQHFLSRKSILDRIARAACGDGACPLVIEIGPGKGGLTGSLLELAPHVIGIEVDPYLVHYLRQKFAADLDAGRLTLIEGDVLKTDFAALIGERATGPARPSPIPQTIRPAAPGSVVPRVSEKNGGHGAIAGNLPYYITSPILEKVFSLEGVWDRAVFLVQAEVAARLAASPGSRAYGYLSVLTQVHACTEILFEVPRTAFHPPPKVDSAVIRLEPRDTTALPDKQEFLRFAAACFRHKRKTLRNNLSSRYGQDCVDTLPQGRLRAEQLSVEDLVGLYRKLEAACPRS